MRITWEISSSDTKSVTAFFDQYLDDREVRNRIKRNLCEKKRRITKRVFWEHSVGCLLTSRQRSGPGSPVRRFLDLEPFPLNYALCLERRRNLSEFARKTISNFGGLRFAPRIGTFVAYNLTKLEDNEWNSVLEQLDQIRQNPTREMEQRTAEYIDATFKGFGPKQARNLLQALGLTRFEIPIDSRSIDWLNEFGFPVKLTASALQDRNYYNFVSDGFQSLCRAAKIYPCLLDAAIFVSVDKRRKAAEF
jgi:hypothetical protein